MATTTTIYASEDTNLRENSPTTNYGSNTLLRVGQYSSYRRHAVLKFDVSSFTEPSDIVTADLTLTNTATSGTGTRTMKIARLNQDFVEAQATWEISATGTSWSGGDGAEGNGQFTEPTYDITVGDVVGEQTMDIKDLIVDAINRRDDVLWLVMCFDPADTGTTPTASSVIHSFEAASASNRPKIAVTVADRITWTGTLNGELDNYRNWSTLAVPTTDDYALFSSGNVDATTNTLECHTIFVGKNYRGSIGSTTSLVRVQANRAYFGSSHSSIHIDLNNGVPTVAEVRITNTSPVSGSFRLDGKYNPTLVRTRHDISLLTSEVTTVEAHTSGAIFTCDDSVTTLNITSATATMDDIPTNATVSGRGYVTLTKVDGSNSAVTVAGTGRVKCLANSLGDVTIYSGARMTFMGNESAPAEVNDVTVYGGGTFDTRTGAPTVQVDGQVTVLGGRILVDGSRAFTVT